MARIEISEAVLKSAVSTITSVAGASVAVKDLSGNNLTVYSAETGAGTLSNPLTSDSVGRVEGYVEAPDFDLTVSHASITTYTHRVRLSPPGTVNVKSYGAKGDGVADDTAKFTAALNVDTGGYSDANQGGMVQVPPGTYIVSNLDMTEGFQGLEGTGMGATLKAKAAATYVVGIEGKIQCALRNLTIDGNSQASHGVRVRASGTLAAENPLIEHCRISQCDIGLYIAPPPSGSVDQAHGGLFQNVYINACNTGTKIWATNAQQQTFIACTIQTIDVACVELKRGGLVMIGCFLGTATSAGTAILLSGTAGASDEMYGCHLIECITEGMDMVIDGTTGWPRHGVKLDGSVIATSAASTGVCVRIGVTGLLHAVDTQFAGGTVELDNIDAAFIDINSDYSVGAAVVKDGTQARHMKWDPIGLTFAAGELDIQPITAGRTPIISRAKASQSVALYKAINGAGNECYRIGHTGFAEFVEQADPVAPAANEARLYVRDSGGKTQLVVRFPTGAIQILATEP